MRSTHPSHKSFLRSVNQTLWRQSAGDQLASLCLAMVQPDSGLVACAWAGSPALLHVREHSYELLCEPSGALGFDPDVRFGCRELTIQTGEALTLCTPSLARVIHLADHRLNATTLATLLMDHLGASAANLADLVRSCCESQAVDLDQVDRGVLVVKRKGS